MDRETVDQTTVELNDVKEPLERFSTLFTNVDPVWLERATKAFLLLWAMGSIGFNGGNPTPNSCSDGSCWQQN